ncbi:vitamin K epoxide reductase family protein [Hippea jasoniae]|uniref:hypothetical protein n=1 Tax=Hippea jasoniae TaxID=944479 RepID=UPI000558B96D|nr:hypothetical protein [Hippea jasoniae]
MKAKEIIKKPEIIIAFIGFCLTTLQFVLMLNSRNICTAEGCRIIEQSLKIDEIYVVMAGGVLFGILTLLYSNLSVLTFYKKDISLLSNIADYLTAAALSIEGVLVGYQLFVAQKICLFCISVFTLIFTLALIRLIKKNFILTIGFISFFGILTTMSILTYQTKPNPLKEGLIIIHKQGCPHCEEVINKLKQTIKNKQLKVIFKTPQQEKALLDIFNIDVVPVMVVNTKSKKTIIIGEDAILNYLSDKATNNNLNYIINDKKGFDFDEGVCKISGKCD